MNLIMLAGLAKQRSFSSGLDMVKFTLQCLTKKKFSLKF